MTTPENVIIEKIQCWHCKHFHESGIRFPKIHCNAFNQKIQAVIFLQDLRNGCDKFDVKDENVYTKFLTNYAASKAEDQAVMN